MTNPTISLVLRRRPISELLNLNSRWSVVATPELYGPLKPKLVNMENARRAVKNTGRGELHPRHSTILKNRVSFQKSLKNQMKFARIEGDSNLGYESQVVACMVLTEQFKFSYCRIMFPKHAKCASIYCAVDCCNT